MTLLIGGARGTGRLTARLLHAKGASVRVLARDPAASTRGLPQGIEVIGGGPTKAQTLFLREVSRGEAACERGPAETVTSHMTVAR